MLLENKSIPELLSVLEYLEELESRQKYNRLESVFPETGKYGRDNYKKHIEFLAAGGRHLIRAFIAANRIGKSHLAAYEVACHLTGKYPTWWQGKRFRHPVNVWVCGIETKQIRSSIQPLLFGSYGDPGTGLIPRNCLLDDNKNVSAKSYPGASDLFGTARVRHYTDGIFDGWSEVEVKTYEQGWMNFQGAKRHVVWMDEEPTDPKVYTECLTRTMGDDGDEGMMICTFTPLHGYTEFLLGFLPDGQIPVDGINPTNPEVKVVMATWDDCPHLSERSRAALLAEYLKTDPNAVEARTKGIAAMGSGKVFPIDESFVVVPQFKIPPYWPKAYGLDPGWNYTAVVWLAKNPDTNVIYAYSEYQHGKVVDLIHAEAIKARGEWLNGAIDPHGAKHMHGDSGITILDYFCSLGLKLVPGTGDSKSLLSMMLSMMQSGAMKIMNSCPELIKQIRTYRYDIKDPNKIADKQIDHEIDAWKYGLAKFNEIAVSYTTIEEKRLRAKKQNKRTPQGRSSITGY